MNRLSLGGKTRRRVFPGNMRPVLEICGEFGKYAVSPEKMRWRREICGDFFKQFHVVYFPEMRRISRWIFRRTKKNTEKIKKT